MNFYKHKTAEIAKTASIGEGTKVWNNCQISDKVKIGKNCTLGKNVYVGVGVVIGENVKVQNNASLYEGLIVESGVFIGPHVVFTNDKFPRAINESGTAKTRNDWKVEKSLVKYGASIGANVTVLPGIVIGKYALVGSGSVVTKDVEDFTLVYGNPASIKGKVDKTKIVERY